MDPRSKEQLSSEVLNGSTSRPCLTITINVARRERLDDRALSALSLWAMHDELLKVVRTLETDYEPYGKVERGSLDCSCGCRHFVKLAGDVGEEWGVCANPESARAGLLTFEHQGCPEFGLMLLDRALTDSQLRALIAEASEILKDRRRERSDSVAADETPLPDERGEFAYEVKTSYFPRIKGHAPGIFRLEPHEGAFVAIPLGSRTSG